MWTYDLEYAFRKQSEAIFIAFAAVGAFSAAPFLPALVVGRPLPPVVAAIATLLVLRAGLNLYRFDPAHVERRLALQAYGIGLVLWPVVCLGLLIFAASVPLMFGYAAFLLLVALFRLKSRLARRVTYGAGTKRDQEQGGFFSGIADLYILKDALFGFAGLGLAYLGQELIWVCMMTLGHALGGVLVICVALVLPHGAED